MASSEVMRFSIELSDVERGVYQPIDLVVARHPSEAAPFLLARVLAYALHVEEGIGFSQGLCEPDEPAVFVRDLTGALTTWIEVGAPSAERLHRATRACPAVYVYAYKDVEPWKKNLAGERIHRAAEVFVRALGQRFLDELAATLAKRNEWTLVRQDDGLLLTTPRGTLEGALEHHRLAEPRA